MFLESRSSREKLGKPNCGTVSSVKDGEHGNTKPLRRSVVHFTRSITIVPTALAWHREEYGTSSPGIAMSNRRKQGRTDGRVFPAPMHHRDSVR
ncbi:hypothetical protein BKA82DRAFT_999765 [Pisolithus tinctorius]|uniref:Uncharacterized protein n=1 Tax=Pisolithus tinctorius Marx 270 TaxID=870435 RepID=A0A0C3NXT6_PISTI|nr:hypothetical protein BKA82DRAFT_999765 [Pisolithus tinctorius]KIO05640.1 hypothetical protein M404DRAFT_999765 [Pisolithus tinctorius Marx 270]